MTTQPEAPRLAEQLEDPANAKLYLAPYIAAELRRLHKENERLKQPRQWQGLTNDEIEDCDPYSNDEYIFARALEAKLKEKNL